LLDNQDASLAKTPIDIQFGRPNLPVKGVDVQFGGFGCVRDGMLLMAVGCVRMMAGPLVVATLVMVRSFAMVLCGVFVVLGGLPMMMCGLLGHAILQPGLCH
jgi:hypothetical protein